MWERLAISCAKTVRPVFIPHCSADAGSRHSAHYGCFQFKSFLGRIPDILRMAKDLSDSAKYFTGHQCFPGFPSHSTTGPPVALDSALISASQRLCVEGPFPSPIPPRVRPGFFVLLTRIAPH